MARLHPLTEGFVNTVKELPDIPKRALTELEKTLGNNVETMGGNLSDKLGEHLATRRAELLGEGVADIKDIPSITDRMNAGGRGDDLLNKSSTKLGELEGAGSVQRGSSEAFSAIFKAMRGDGVQSEILTAAQNALKEAKKQTQSLTKIANKESSLVVGTV